MSTDIHKETASLIFSIPMDRVTEEQRRYAKMLNYFHIYGIPFKAIKPGIPK